jgi:subtilisin family serine protease
VSEQEYIVSLHRGVDAEEFNQEMIALTGNGIIPNRTVDVVNARPGSYRNTHYALTKEEANALQNDPRVYGVEIDPELRDDIRPMLSALQEGNFNKSTSESGQYYDWGKIRHSYVADQYAGGTTTSANWPYALDGTGVDVVIQDSGLQVDHPEFTDKDGNSRVQQIDWATASGLPFTQSANFYRDYDGHGTHVAGTAAGKTFGWAKNARVYSVKVSGLEGAGDSGTGISATYCFDCIKLWHRNKPVDPVTGVKRPTIVNMSWGYRGYYQFISGDTVVYRGTSRTGVSSAFVRDNYGLPNISYGTIGGLPYYLYNARVASVDTDVQELIDEGIHVCIAAGNGYYKIDVSTGSDYNNYATAQTYNFSLSSFTPGTFYYHRGGSPYDDEAFKVGNIKDSYYYLGGEVKADSSECGPGVNMYAAGTNIISCTSNTNKFVDAAYFADSNYKQMNISGTSMASPQVCGLGALYLQANPQLTPAQLREMLINDCVENQLRDDGATNYTYFQSIMGGPNRILNSRYAQQNAYTTSYINGSNLGFNN